MTPGILHFISNHATFIKNRGTATVLTNENCRIEFINKIRQKSIIHSYKFCKTTSNPHKIAKRKQSQNLQSTRFAFEKHCPKRCNQVNLTAIAKQLSTGRCPRNSKHLSPTTNNRPFAIDQTRHPDNPIKKKDSKNTFKHRWLDSKNEPF